MGFLVKCHYIFSDLKYSMGPLLSVQSALLGERVSSLEKVSRYQGESRLFGPSGELDDFPLVDL